jgi:hypothetical protein
MSAELFDNLPFNLRGEELREEIDTEGALRVEAENKANERKAQTTMKWDDPQYWQGVSVGICATCNGGHVLKHGRCWNCRHPNPNVKIYALHDDTNENAL